MSPDTLWPLCAKNSEQISAKGSRVWSDDWAALSEVAVVVRSTNNMADGFIIWLQKPGEILRDVERKQA